MRYRASPKLIDSIIQSESDGNPYARSPVGAMGLMQVMPNTARNPGFGVEPLENPWDPEANKRFGTDYFNAMLNRYGGDREAALVAYNAGPGNADKWVSAGKDWSVLPKPEETRPYVTATLGRLGEDTDMATGSHIPLRARVDLPELRPETRITPRAVPRKTAEPLPTLPPPKSGASDIPGRPSKNDLSMAQALMQAGQRDAQNTRGTGLGLAGALAQQLSGAYMAGSYDDQQDQYNEALNEAFAGAEDRGDLMNVMMRSGDEGLRNAALKARLSQPKPSNRYDASPDGGIFDKTTGKWVQKPPDPSLAASREAEAKDVGKSRAERRSQIYNDAQEAVANNRRLDYFEKLNKRATTGGFLTETSLGAKRFLGFFGIDPEALGLDNNAGLNEAFKALTTRSALDVSQQTKGAITEREMDMFIEAVPSLRNTKEGNQLIIDFLRAANKRRIEINKRAVDYVRERGSLDEGFVGQMQEIYEANPIPDLSGYAQPDEGKPEEPAESRIAPGTQVDDPSSLPDGAVVRDPETGQRFIIRNGQPVPVEEEPTEAARRPMEGGPSLHRFPRAARPRRYRCRPCGDAGSLARADFDRRRPGRKRHLLRKAVGREHRAKSGLA